MQARSCLLKGSSRQGLAPQSLPTAVPGLRACCRRAAWPLCRAPPRTTALAQYRTRTARCVSALQRCQRTYTSASGSYAWAAPQDADFLYLTGIVQQAVAIISAPSLPNRSQYTLFVPNANLERERWDGASINCEAAVHMFGADEAYPVSEVAPL